VLTAAADALPIVITVDDGPLHGLQVNFVEDFEFDNGYVSPYLVTDPGSMLAVLDEPYMLFCAEKISDVRSLMPVLEKIMRDPRPLVIVAEKVEGSALQMLVHNHVNGHLKVTAIQAPGCGGYKAQVWLTGIQNSREVFRMELNTYVPRMIL